MDDEWTAGIARRLKSFVDQPDKYTVLLCGVEPVRRLEIPGGGEAPFFYLRDCGIPYTLEDYDKSQFVVRRCGVVNWYITSVVVLE